MIIMSGNRKKFGGVPVFLFLCLCFGFVFFSCNPKSTGINSSESFQKIYDMPDTSSFTAVDIKQTMDGGYIIMAEVSAEGKEWSYPYLLKVDNQGNFMWETNDNTFGQYVNPITNLLIINENYYIFCNKVPDSQSNKVADVKSPIALLKLTEINNEPDEPKPVHFSDDLFNLNDVDYHDEKDRNIFPLHASKTPDDSILLLAFDEPNTRVLVRKMDINGERIWKDRHENHFQDICQYTHSIQDKRHHFTGIAEAPGNTFYYFQSYSRYNIFRDFQACFRLAKIDHEDGKINTEGEYPVIIPFIALDFETSGPEDVKFSGARIKDNIVSLLVNEELVKAVKKGEEGENEGLDDLDGYPQHELFESKPVYIKTMVVNGGRTSFFVGSTKKNKIVLYAYDWSNPGLPNQEYFGHTNIYEASGLIGTSDGGLAVLGTTYLAGRLGRICLFKLSKAELEDFVRR